MKMRVVKEERQKIGGKARKEWGMLKCTNAEIVTIGARDFHRSHYFQRQILELKFLSYLGSNIGTPE